MSTVDPWPFSVLVWLVLVVVGLIQLGNFNRSSGSRPRESSRRNVKRFYNRA
jgi:hypothetical protein